MSAYLQRLFDRAMPAPPSASLAAALPAGPSLSPVAQADQRLNVPGLADQLGVAAVGEPLLESGPRDTDFLGPVDASATATLSPAQPRSQDRITEVSTPEFAPSPAMQVDPQPAPAAPPALFRGVGTIDADDLVLPEQAAPADTERMAQASPVLPTSPAPQRAEPTLAPKAEIASPQVIEPALPVRAVPAPMPGLEPRSPASPTEARATESLASPPSIELPPQVEAERPQAPADAPLQVQVPPLRVPALETPEPAVVASPTHPAPRPSLPQPAPEPPRQQAQPTRPRPVSANEASVIGPLAARQRVHTLFGLRRR